MEDTVSVIIPVHNGEKYIERCIDSILNQSFKNVEILIIDDNSKDTSPKIIHKYSRENNTIKYIRNEKTLGPALTRNRGLELVNSTYVLFLDCDDWIDLNCIEKSVEKFKSNPDIDIVIWEIKTAYKYNRVCTRYEYLYNNTLSSTMALKLLSHSIENEFFLSPLLGCKLFKTSILTKNHILFYDTLYEDDLFTYLAFLNSNMIALVTGSSLYYYQRSESVSHHFTEKNICDFFITFQILYKYINTTQKETYYKYFTKCLKSMINCMLNNVSDFEMQKNYKIKLFSSFYEFVNIEEYYSYEFSITI
ncbi:glycosyltransferase family 2 protein [Extibacter muris]|uniref:glycosyltransferase family 2 protein n=1 Tax=Extibacter muris TaxID=1796622 RepID=UPI001D07C6D0|nr:glycosyltransferase family A protein [Extibacter muris]MCB6200757.1 glycosyltransferase family 2 protein [Extibacter muris]MCQ4665874.1 glycosyltransferase family 2 protein [Extibacter muris]MCQ4695417.1 glycosyltransferase family 2 protein [Extibacter muris]